MTRTANAPTSFASPWSTTEAKKDWPDLIESCRIDVEQLKLFLPRPSSLQEILKKEVPL